MKDRDEYVQKIQSQLTKWDTDIDMLEAKVNLSSAEAKSKYTEELEDLKARKFQLEKKVEEMKAAAGEAWEELTSGIDQARQDLSKALQSALERLK